jgi:phage-related protein
MVFEHLGWLVINILLPFFLPLLGLLSFKILPLPSVIEVRFIALIKDGHYSLKQWLSHYKTLVTSIGISFLTAILACILHFAT